METIKVGKLTRAITSSEIKVDTDSRTMEFPFSSELPVDRWFGREILSHKDGAYKFDRLNTKAPLLFNHKMDDLVGVVEKAWMGEDGRGWVKVRFSQNDDAQKRLRDVQDGILQNVSFGYMIKEMMLTKSGEDGDEYTATDWEPYEVSLVTVPADTSVGVGRAEGAKDIDVKVIRSLATEPAIEPTPAATAAPSKERKMEPTETAKIAGDAVKAERDRQNAIRALGAKFSKQELAQSLIDGEKTVDEARAAFLDAVGSTQKPLTGKEGEVGMSEKDLGKFSIVRLINALGNPQDAAAQKAAGFELEISRAAAEKMGRAARGMVVPVDVLRAPLALGRALNVGTSTAGGNLVSTDLLSQSFIDLLRKKSILNRAGATVLNGLVGNIAIPRQTGAATAYWVAEGVAPADSQQAIDQVTMSPKTVGARSEFTRKLMLQSSIDVEAMVRLDLATVLALEIDRAGLYGSGSAGQPTGLKLTSGINTEDFAAATPTFAEIVSMESKIAADDADVDNMKYLVNASMRGALKTAQKASGYPVYLWENDMLNGYSALTSNQLESGDIFFGNFADLVMGFWSGLDLMIDPYALSTSGGMRVIALQDVDVAVRHPESFCRGNNTL